MICDLLALRPISHITKKTLSYLHSTKIEQMTKTMVIFKRGAIFLCCIRCDPIPPQASVQRLAHTRNVTTCCSSRVNQLLITHAERQIGQYRYESEFCNFKNSLQRSRFYAKIPVCLVPRAHNAFRVTWSERVSPMEDL